MPLKRWHMDALHDFHLMCFPLLLLHLFAWLLHSSVVCGWGLYLYGWSLSWTDLSPVPIKGPTLFASAFAWPKKKLTTHTIDVDTKVSEKCVPVSLNLGPS